MVELDCSIKEADEKIMKEICKSYGTPRRSILHIIAIAEEETQEKLHSFFPYLIDENFPHLR